MANRMGPLSGLALCLAVALADVETAAGASRAFLRARLVKQISADPFAGAAGSQADTQTEPHVAFDPTNPSTLVAVFQQGRFADGASVGPGYAASHDGGRTWSTGSLPGLTVATGGSFDRGSDAVVAIGPDGAVYAQTLLVNTQSDSTVARTAVAVQRSDDGGLTFAPPVMVEDDVFSSPFAFNDKNWIAVDTFPGGPHQGRVYSVWAQGPSGLYQLVLRYSDDRGATWSSLVAISAGAFPVTQGAQPVVLPNGDVSIIYNAVPPCLEVSQTSHDGGEHFDPPVTIGACKVTTVPGMRTAALGFLVLPAAAVDPLTGSLYVVWQDGGFRSDGLNDIVLAVSHDGGASWRGPVVVVAADGARGLNRFTPAVAAYDGAVAVAYSSRRAAENKVLTRYVVSADGAVTFGRERRLGRPGNLGFAARATDHLHPEELAFLGDYMGLVMSPRAAHAVWCRPSRPRSNAMPHQTTWSARIPRAVPTRTRSVSSAVHGSSASNRIARTRS